MIDALQVELQQIQIFIMQNKSLIVDDMQLKSKLTALLQVTKNKTQVLREIGYQIESGIATNFKKQEDSNGVKWAPNRRGGMILQDKGNLRRMVSEVQDDRHVLVGTMVDYGTCHQYGTKGNRIREWLYISQDCKKRINTYLENKFKEAIK